MTMGDSDICYGLVGDSRFCISQCAPGIKGCGKSSKHVNVKAKAFVEGYEQMYTVPAQASKGSLTSFLEPIVPVTDVDTYCSQSTRDEFTKNHTSQEWAALISIAIDEINTALELDKVYEEEEENSSEEDSEPTALGDFNPEKVTYSEYTPPVAVNIPPPVFKTEVGSDSEVEKAITEHHEAIATNADLMKDIARSVPAAAISTIKHLDPTLQGLVAGYNQTVSAMQRVIAGLGNWEQLGVYGHSDLSQAIVAALEVEVDLAMLEETRATIEELQTLVGDMDDRLKSSSTQVIGAIAGQIKKIHVRMLNIESLIPRQQQGLSSVSHLDASTPIIGAGGVDMGTLGTLLERVTTLESNYETLRADISSQGGVVVGPHLIASEEALKKIIAQELKDPKKAIAAFTDGVSIFIHSKDAKVGATDSDAALQEEMKTLREAGLLQQTLRKYVTSFRRIVPYLFNKGNNIGPGEKMTCAPSMETWNGFSKMTGHKTIIKRNLNEAKTSVQRYIRDFLPSTGILHAIAMDLVTDALQFHSDLEVHLTEDMRKLTEMGVPEKEVMELAAEETMLMFTKLFTVRKDVMDFDAEMDIVDYIARLWWGTLLANKEMKAFTENGIAYHPTISAAFIRFLTAQLGQNMEVNLADKVSQLEERVTAVSGVASGAQSTANRCKAWQTNLLSRNPTLTHPN